MAIPKPISKAKLLEELNEMARRVNEWEKPYGDYPGKWTREASLAAYPIISKIIKLAKRL